MITDVFGFFPYFANGLVALSLLFKLYNRSVSAFTTFVTIAMASNFAYYGYLEFSAYFMIFMMAVIMIRAMVKAEKDTLFVAKSNRLCDEKCVADLIREMKEQEC